MANSPLPKPSAPGPAVTFRPISFADVPGWEHDDHVAALKAFTKSCGPILEAVKSGARVQTPPPPGLLSACREAQSASKPTSSVARAFFESHFTPHKVVHRGPQGLLTGYYEPVLNGSRKAEGAFQVPIYRRPPELVNLVDETMRGATGEALTHARKTPKGLEPYFTRAEIESSALKGRGLELLYLSDPVDAFFMHIQGSGRIKLTDGTTVRITYDGKNGHPYRSIGRHLIDAGELGADKVSLQTLGAWLRANPARGKQVMWHNASFVFFRELDGVEAGQAMGAMKISLTPGRSLAVDAGVHAIGTPIYVVAPTLKHALRAGPFQRLMIAQDVGSAITGPERGDIYFGSGSNAGRLAGVTKHPGTFIVFLPQQGPQRPTQPNVAGVKDGPASTSGTRAGRPADKQ